MRLDTGKAWTEAAATVSANKEVLVAIAGVFFFLPALMLALFFPQPEPPAGAQPRELFAMLETYYLHAGPWLLAGALVQVLGQLAVLMLTARAGQATVGDAIRAAIRALPSYVGTQLVLIGAIFAAFLTIRMIAVLSQPLAVLLGLIVAGLAVWVSIRCLLTPVVIAVEGARHPLAVLRRSWDLTRGNAGRITLFAIVLALAVSVLAAVASALTGIVLALVGGPAVGRIAGDAAVALVGAAAATYFAISFAAIHRQLAGTARTDPAVFE